MQTHWHPRLAFVDVFMPRTKDPSTIDTMVHPPRLPADRLAYSIIGAADALSISRSRIYELVANGEVGTCKIGKRTVIPAAELTAFLERHRVARAAAVEVDAI